MLRVLIRDGTRRAAGRVAVPAAVRFPLVLALLVGLVGMHATTVTAPARHAHVPAAAGGSGCVAHGGDPAERCPEDGHGHLGPVCLSGAVIIGLALLTPTVTAVAAPRPAPPMLMTTADIDAAGGTGCGPPSLVQLSISRT